MKESDLKTIYIEGKVFSLESKFSFLDYSIEAVNAKSNETVKKQELDIDGNFKLSLEVNDDYNEFLINVFDENHNLVEIDENSTNSISYKRAINPGCNILPSSINLYLDEVSSLTLKNNDESIDLESQIEFVKDYSRKFNSSHVIAFKGEKIPI